MLPIEAFCNGAIAATMEEMVVCNKGDKFDTVK